MPSLLRPPPPPPNRLPMPAIASTVQAWPQVLRACGYPTDVLVIDFETYFDDEYSMRDLSTIEYVTNPRFEVMSCAFTRMGEGFDADAHTRVTVCSVGEQKVIEAVEFWSKAFPDLSCFTIVAQNAAFDCTVLARRFGIYPKYIIDILGLARAQNARQRNDLGSLCKQHGLKDKGETADFKGLSFRPRWHKPKGKGPKMPTLRPRITDDQIQKLREYNVNDNLREWELFTILLPKLSNPQIELPLMQHHIESFTKPTLRVDFAKGTELIAQMQANIGAAIPAGMTPEDISGNKSFEHFLCEALKASNDTPLRYTKWGKKGAMLALAKADDAREELLNHPAPGVQALMKARVAVKSWPLHIKRIERIVAQARAADGLLCVPLKYHGAHTGRASGGESINLQNLGSRGDPLISAVRSMIVAPEGHKLVIVDASAIEARVLAWIAGQWDLVEKFKNGEEIYCGFASKVLGYPVRKPRKTGGIAAIESRMAWARNSVGKIGVLGCGYGMGAEKAQGYAGGAIDLATAERIVQVYRAENQHIVQFWRDIEKAFAYTLNYRKPCALERGLGFVPLGDHGVAIVLPNGRKVNYPRVRISSEGIEVFNAYNKAWERTWGGTFTENVVQAISRDVLMEALLRLEARGHHTALHVHDELVIVASENQAEECLKLTLAELSLTPAWAPRLALAAEGGISERYGKH